jgi:3-oxosteroid 1-dehydrogenase
VSKESLQTDPPLIYDVIVVGTGAAGFAAALAAREQGASVVMLEKSAELGGTTRKAGVWIWIPNNSFLRATGRADPRDKALRYMARLARPHAYDPTSPSLGLPQSDYALLETFYDQAGEAVEMLVRKNALRPLHRPEIPDYYAELPENAAPYGRVIVPYSEVRASGGTGQEFVTTLARAARAENVEIRTSCRVSRAIVDDERVVGVDAMQNGREVSVRARGGVVFATGGFTHNRELMLRSFGVPLLHGAAAPSNEGDFVDIAGALGARFGNMSNAWMAAIQLEQARTKEDALTNANITELHGDSAVVVNRHGRRVVNEKAVYNDFAHAFFHWDGARGEYPNLRLFLIYDDASARIYGDDASGNPIVPPGGNSSHVIRAATLSELASRLNERLAALGADAAGVRLGEEFASNLSATIERFNGYALAGVDEEFRRGETAIELYFSGEARSGNGRNATMYPFDPAGGYNAIILAPSTLDTKGGPIIDTNARVIGADGTPIPGLYGAGNCIASPSGEGYWGGGATVGLAITFGRIAGLGAASDTRGR